MTKYIICDIGKFNQNDLFQSGMYVLSHISQENDKLVGVFDRFNLIF